MEKVPDERTKTRLRSDNFPTNLANLLNPLPSTPPDGPVACPVALEIVPEGARRPGAQILQLPDSFRPSKDAKYRDDELGGQRCRAIFGISSGDSRPANILPPLRSSFMGIGATANAPGHKHPPDAPSIGGVTRDIRLCAVGLSEWHQQAHHLPADDALAPRREARARVWADRLRSPEPGDDPAQTTIPPRLREEQIVASGYHYGLDHGHPDWQSTSWIDHSVAPAPRNAATSNITLPLSPYAGSSSSHGSGSFSSEFSTSSRAQVGLSLLPTLNGYPNALDHQRRCANCATTKTPSWRRCGPSSSTLCNACGLYYMEHRTNRPFRKDAEGKTRALRVSRPVVEEARVCDACGQRTICCRRRDRADPWLCIVCGGLAPRRKR